MPRRHTAPSYSFLTEEVVSESLRQTTQDYVSSRRRSFVTALFAALLINLVVMIVLIFMTVSTSPPPPPVIIASYGTIENEESSVPSPPDINPMAAPAASAAPGQAVSVVSAITMGPIAISPMTTTEEKDLSVGFHGINPGFGTSMGLGGGSDGFGSMQARSIGKMQVKAKRLGVVLDVSGSMTSHLPAVRKEIQKSFSNATTILIDGCRLDWDPDFVFKKTAERSSRTGWTASSVIEAINILVTRNKVDAIYWFSDLQDGETEQGRQRLLELLRVSEGPDKAVRLYIRSLEQQPTRKLNMIVRASGGLVEISSER